MAAIGRDPGSDAADGAFFVDLLPGPDHAGRAFGRRTGCVTIGRAGHDPKRDAAHIYVHVAGSAKLSRKQCQVRRMPGQVVAQVEHLGKRPTTVVPPDVGAQPVRLSTKGATCEVAHGSRLQAGGFEFNVWLHDPTPASASGSLGLDLGLDLGFGDGGGSSGPGGAGSFATMPSFDDMSHVHHDAVHDMLHDLQQHNTPIAPPEDEAEATDGNSSDSSCEDAEVVEVLVQAPAAKSRSAPRGAPMVLIEEEEDDEGGSNDDDGAGAGSSVQAALHPSSGDSGVGDAQLGPVSGTQPAEFAPLPPVDTTPSYLSRHHRAQTAPGSSTLGAVPSLESVLGSRPVSLSDSVAPGTRLPGLDEMQGGDAWTTRREAALAVWNMLRTYRDRQFPTSAGVEAFRAAYNVPAVPPQEWPRIPQAQRTRKHGSPTRSSASVEAGSGAGADAPPVPAAALPSGTGEAVAPPPVPPRPSAATTGAQPGVDGLS